MGVAAFVSRYKWWLAGGGVGLFLIAKKTADETETILTSGAGGTIRVKLTGYWPKVQGLSAEDRTREGKDIDSHSNPLYTLEQYQRGEAPYVSVSGDDAIWPYGQRISIDSWPGVEFRVVDTGGNFRGAGKMYRIIGREPLDICVDGPDTYIPNARGAVATIYAGDAYGSKKTPDDVQWDLFEGQGSV